MKEIRIKRSEVLRIVRENLEKHKAEFVEAKKAYADKVVETSKPISMIPPMPPALSPKMASTMPQSYDDSRFASARRIATTAREITRIVTPLNCEKKYLDLIRKFELDTRDEIELTESEFDSWILDKAQWRENARSSNSSYAMGMSSPTDDEEDLTG